MVNSGEGVVHAATTTTAMDSLSRPQAVIKTPIVGAGEGRGEGKRSSNKAAPDETKSVSSGRHTRLHRPKKNPDAHPAQVPSVKPRRGMTHV